MHTVVRGAEPAGLKTVRKKYTPKWVAYYAQDKKKRKGKKPGDSEWRAFLRHLRKPFHGLCGYCEREDKGEVDHFRPKSKYPKQVYEWTNWVFACHTCNHNKGGLWPRGGYVDPCAQTTAAQPESHFDFDTKTGEIVPRAKAQKYQQHKAKQMASDLDLNAYYHLQARTRWLEVITKALDGEDEDDPKTRALVELFSSPRTPLSSIATKWLREQGYRLDS
jgi:uncharacterized protein (TIGR02646 family)